MLTEFEQVAYHLQAPEVTAANSDACLGLAVLKNELLLPIKFLFTSHRPGREKAQGGPFEMDDKGSPLQ